MSLAGFLRQVVEVLEGAEIPYVLTGSLASAYHATPRATQDIDLVIEPDAQALERAVAGLSEAGYYVDRRAAMEALELHGRFNAIDPKGGWKADFIIRKDRAFSRSEFQRREAASLLGVELSLASLEDVLVAKLEWSKLGDSELQRRDVGCLLERAGPRLDVPYVEHWVSTLDLSEEWTAAKKRARKGSGRGED